MGKADIEVQLFSIYLVHIMKNRMEYDDYTLAVQLGIPDTRVWILKKRVAISLFRLRLEEGLCRTHTPTPNAMTERLW